MGSFIPSTYIAWGWGQCSCPHGICILLRETDNNQGSKYVIPGGDKYYEENFAEQGGRESNPQRRG